MGGPKAENVEKMFDSIASDYDHLNHLFSLDIDKTWRRRALKRFVSADIPQNILDLACGTGDFSIEIARHSHPSTLVTGLDLSSSMLSVMENKLREAGLQDRISTRQANCEEMDYADNSFDAVSIGFGIRNFENRDKALKEILRVLKPGGKLVIIELSIPSIPIVRGLYKFYFLKILPWIGGLISGDKSAYKYLPASVVKFPSKEVWMATMSECGFKDVSHKAFSLGICRMYIGVKYDC